MRVLLVYPQLPRDRTLPCRSPRHTWLRTLEANSQPHKRGMNGAWRHVESISWKWLCSSQGHGYDDDKDRRFSTANFTKFRGGISKILQYYHPQIPIVGW